MVDRTLRLGINGLASTCIRHMALGKNLDNRLELKNGGPLSVVQHLCGLVGDRDCHAWYYYTCFSLSAWRT